MSDPFATIAEALGVPVAEVHGMTFDRLKAAHQALTAPPEEEIWIWVEDVQREVAEAKPCPDCRGDLAIIVSRDENGEHDWQVVTTHDATCPAVPKQQTP